MNTDEEQLIFTSIDLELKSLNETVKAYNKKIKDLEESKVRIQNSKKNEITVTDHALLRYYERFYQLEMENIREEILYDFNSHHTLMKNGNGKLITDKITYVVKDNKIITLY